MPFLAPVLSVSSAAQDAGVGIGTGAGTVSPADGFDQFATLDVRALDVAALDVVRGAVVGVGTLGLVLVLALVIGVALLFRRRGRGGRNTSSGSSGGIGSARGGTASGAVGPRSDGPRLAPSNASLGIEELSLQAGATLVRADDAVETAENEVGFAVAQFGPERTREFADAVSGARAQVAEAFRLQQQLDDAYPDTDQQRRDWTKRIIALGDTASRTIDEHTQQFTALRRTEADSPARLQALRSGIAETRALLPASRALLARITSRFQPHLTAEVQSSADAAEQSLTNAEARADAVAARVEAGGATAVSSELDAAANQVHDARRLLGAIDDTAASLSQAEAALTDLIAATRGDLNEARAVRDNAPDAETGARVLGAVDEVEFVLGDAEAAASSTAARIDPVHDLGRLGAAVAALDTALAGARNQQQRLTHASTALVGALVGARSEIAVAKTYMATNRSGVDARTRLAEAERQLMLAEAETDPVDALDAARRAATAARDADALARYRG